MAIHGVVRTDNMAGTDVRGQLVSVKYIVNDTATDIDNGCVLKLDGLMDGEREIYKGVAVAANDDLSKIVLVASPEVMYDPRLRKLADFYNDASKPCRGYHIHSGDTFSVTKAALGGLETPAVGNVVELAAGNKLNVAAEPTSGSTQVGTIIAIDVVGENTYNVIKVD